MSDFEFLTVFSEDFISVVELRHREKGNALNLKMWSEIHEAFTAIGADPKSRVVLLIGDGDNFCSGTDMNDYKEFIDLDESKREKKPAKEAFGFARQSLALRQQILQLQKAFAAVESCPKPVLAAVHGHCIDGGVGLLGACDVRLASATAVFALKEIEIAAISYCGALSRLPKLCKHASFLRDVAFTGRRFDAMEALKHGLISTVFDSDKELLAAARKMAEVIAEKSPVAIQTSKKILNFARDHKQKEAEKFGNALRMLTLQSRDMKEALRASRTQTTRPPSRIIEALDF
ncbi:hypothetical protein L596_028669 [Steinernema carpocapsae]|uniref:Enoyl-CoA hydratase n=1 Tax=Steinernema carpocapsae TaxID=34508 RepID=A0A4U5LZ22_STECR|nr:hypothetical protein L596_028669 [Steinernema carpocapsae]